MAEAVLQAQPGLPHAETGRIPGNKGIWVGITCEIVEFVVLFAVYFVARAHFPDAFHEGAQRLSLVSGTRHHAADGDQQLFHRLLGQRHPQRAPAQFAAAGWSPA